MKQILLLFALLFTTPLFAGGIGANATSATCDNTTLETYNGTANVEIDWQPNTINLNWYDGDTKLNVQSGAQTCNYGGILNVPSVQPTRTGYTFKGWELKTILVPSGYTQLEYLESTNGQYIDTGVTLDVNSKIEVKFKVPTYLGNYAVFGASNGSAYNTGEIAFFYNNISENKIFEPVVPSSNSTSTVLFQPSFNVNADYVVYMDKNSTIINNSTRTTSWYASYQGTRSLYMFATNRGSSSWIGGNTKIYYLNVYNNNTHVLNMIPARRNSDNVVGMWDTVTQTFFTNAGTGAFTAGPDVQ